MISFCKNKLTEDEKRLITDIYEKHRGLLYSVVLNYTHNKDEYEDILQDAWLRLVVNVNALKGKETEAMLGYMVVAGKSAALNYLRSRNSKIRSNTVYCEPMELEAIADSSFSGKAPEDVLIEHEDMLYLINVIKSLSKKQQQLIVGKYQIGLNDDTLAKITGYSPKSVRVMIGRARKMLLEELEKEDVSDE